MKRNALWVLGVLGLIMPFQAAPQTATDIVVLKGLAPVTVLSKTYTGNAALAANYVATGGIQNGTIRQATLLPFTEQQQQALRDVFITNGNLAEMADGLGSTLGYAYLARAHYIDPAHYTNLSESVADIIKYADATTQSNAGSAKYFFANATTDGKTQVSGEAMAILKNIAGDTDIFGKSYHHAAGSAGANAYGNSRPFQTEPSITLIIGPDYFYFPSSNLVYNYGPLLDLSNSPSYPSGHTSYGYTGALLLAMLAPDRYSQMITRGAEYGNDRILIGAHYAMDVMGGRTLALYDMAHLLANDPAYVGHSLPGAPLIKDFQAAVKEARADLTMVLQAACGKTIAECAREDTSRFSNPAANEAFYDETQTYNLPVVYPQNANKVEDVRKLAPEAGYLLTTAFPWLTLEEADQILTMTEGPGGGFLDNGTSFGVYSRLNLYAAAKRAEALGSAHSSTARPNNSSAQKGN
jgi:hypothetical protein